MAGTAATAAAVTDSDRSVIFVVDTSGSMGGTPIEQARQALSQAVEELDPTIAAGLRTFAGSCGDAGDLLVPVGLDNRAALQSAAQTLAAGGGTPTPDALRAAVNDLPASGQRTIVLISDGQSTCGDPCLVAKDLRAQGIDFTVHAVGFNATANAESELKCIADATGGQYFSATDSSGLAAAIGSAISSRQLNYVALGDSYSAGEGAGAGYYFQTNGKDIKCHRAPTAWSFVVAESSTQIADPMQNFACTGAKTQHVEYEWYKGEQPQVQALREHDKALRSQGAGGVDLVTITIGGNDAGFSGMIKDCFLSDCAKDATNGNWRKKWREAARSLAQDIVPKLRVAAPDASIVIVGYPRLLPETQAEVTGCGWLTSAERSALNKMAEIGNKYYIDAIFTEGFENPGYVMPDFISPMEALDGHELCSSDSHVVKIYGNAVNSEQGHPTAAGQRDYARVVTQGLKELGIISK